MTKKRVYVETSVMDSLEEVRAIKEELSREFPTAQAFGEYLRIR